LKFLLVIMSQLKHAMLVRSSRGSDGGYSLSRPPADITLADVLRAVEGPLVDLHDSRIGELEHRGAAEPLIEVWMAVRTNVRAVLESVTLADVASARLPAEVKGLARRYRRAPGSQSRQALLAGRAAKDVPPRSRGERPIDDPAAQLHHSDRIS
jgi:Rrf2 family protein